MLPLQVFALALKTEGDGYYTHVIQDMYPDKDRFFAQRGVLLGSLGDVVYNPLHWGLRRVRIFVACIDIPAPADVAAHVVGVRPELFCHWSWVRSGGRKISFCQSLYLLLRVYFETFRTSAKTGMYTLYAVGGPGDTAGGEMRVAGSIRNRRLRQDAFTLAEDVLLELVKGAFVQSDFCLVYHD